MDIFPKLDTKFFVSWLLCSLSMFGASFAWHGLFLNDLLRISYPQDVFFTVAALVYLGLGVLITITTYVLKKLKSSFKYGILVGAFFGVFIYAVAFLLGISFYATPDIKMIVFDLAWQVTEQGFGGLVCAITYRTLAKREKGILA